ncbi:MAG: hypothetical protein KatS3mg054_0641 [Chloroflexus sp.]|nr:MAG: hypothetical protein KatS3mg054_0641 [Chloroflexus sp.]
MIIKSTNPRFTKGMILNGNELSGDTYNARENIKKFWDGKWDSARKVWIVNPEKVMATLNSKWNWGLAIGDDEQPAAVTAQPVTTATTAKVTVKPAPAKKAYDGWCDKCHSYCWGDCSAH